MKSVLKPFLVGATMSLVLMSTAAFAQAPPVVGTIGVPVEEVKVLAKGWSIKKDILNKDAYNESGEKVGVVEDIIVMPDKAMSYAIVSTGGFLGLAKHDVVIPVSQFNIKNMRIIIAGATKEALKAQPEFTYAD